MLYLSYIVSESSRNNLSLIWIHVLNYLLSSGRKGVEYFAYKVSNSLFYDLLSLLAL